MDTSFPDLKSLGDALRSDRSSAATLRSVWDASVHPRADIVRALLDASSAAVEEFELIASSQISLHDLSLCAAAAASAASDDDNINDNNNNNHKHTRRILLACAHAAARRNFLPTASRIVAVALQVCGGDFDTIIALADSGFIQEAARAALRINRHSSTPKNSPALVNAILLVIPQLRNQDERLRSELAAVVMPVAASVRDSAQMRACLLTIRTAALEHPVVVDVLLALYERSLASSFQSTESHNRFEKFLDDTRATCRISPFDIASIFVLLSSSNATETKKRILHLLHGLCLAPQELFVQPPTPRSRGASSSSAPPFIPPSPRTAAFSSALQVPGMEEYSVLVADVCDSLLRAPEEEARKSAAEFSVRLFSIHEGARSRILAYFIEAFNDSTGTLGENYASLLHRLADHTAAAAFFRSHVTTVAEWIPFAVEMPFENALVMLKGLARIAANLPTLADKLLIKVRKMMNERSAATKYLAVHTLVAMAEAPATTQHLFQQVTKVLQEAIKRERDLRVPTLSLLVDAVRAVSNYTRTVRWAPLNRAISLELAQVCARNVAGVEDDVLAKYSTRMKLAHCFAECCGGFPARRDVPLLVAYAKTLPISGKNIASITDDVEKYVSDVNGGLLEVCAPPRVMNETLQGRWVFSRASILLSLCETMIMPLQSESGAASSSSTSSAKEVVPLRVILIYALAFTVRDSLPRNTWSPSVHERSCSSAMSSSCISAREKSVQNKFSSSKMFELFSAAGAVDGVCSLHEKGCLVVLRNLNRVQEVFGKYVSSLAGAEVLARWNDVLKDEDISGDVQVETRGFAIRAFSETNPSAAYVEKRKEKRKKPRRSSKTAEQPSPRRRMRSSLRMQTSEIPNSTTTPTISNVTTSSEEGVIDVLADVDVALKRMRYKPASTAISRALEKRDDMCEESRTTLRSSAISLLLRTASKDYEASEWSFLVGSSGVRTSGTECVREIVELFERDFRRAMSPDLAFGYLRLLEWFLKCDSGAKSHVVGAASRILSEYDISQVRIVRGLFRLLLEALEIEQLLPVAQDVIAWLGEQEGALDPSYKRDGKHGSRPSAAFDIDIVEEACELDGVSTAALSEKLYPRAIDDGASTTTMEGDEGQTRPSRKRLLESDGGNEVDVNKGFCLPGGVYVRKLGLNESDEICLACIQVALLHVENAVPPLAEVRTLSDDAVSRLSGCVSALSALLATQRNSGISLARPVIRRAEEAMARLLSAVDVSLHACRKEMTNEESELPAERFSQILAVCVSALRNIMAKSAGRALVNEGKARRAAARLELHLPTALTDLAVVCRGAPELEEVEKAYREVVGADGAEMSMNRPAISTRRKKKSGRLRSRNVVVDAWLEDEDEEDDFADLEDFVIGMDDEVL